MRNEKDVVIDDPGRDQGKIFHIQEMDAFQAESWAMRALMAVAKSGVDIGEAAGGGMQALAILGMRAVTSLDYEVARPLLDEMMACVTIKPDPTKPAFKRAIITGEIEEVATIMRLRLEVFDLHTGFSTAGFLSKISTSAVPATSPASSNTPTSPGPSVQFSHTPRTKRPR